VVRVSKTHHVKLSKHLSDLRQLARAIEQKEDRGPLGGVDKIIDV